MAKEDRFRQSIIATLARRAANRCSNPDCGAVTSGPADDPSRSVNVGEAAHIFGANPGSARYDSEMASAERSDITNAIWLCNTCHKIVDDDPVRYPAGLLFEWQREHERQAAATLGKTAANLRKRYEDRKLEEFGRLSYSAERLLLEKPDFWEYLLTSEVLRFEMSPILSRWRALKRGLYMKPVIAIDETNFPSWTSDRFAELTTMSAAFNELVNVEFARAWGEPGAAGNDSDIVATCRLFAEMCQSVLTWEETVRFASVDEVFEELHKLLIGAGGLMIDEAARVPAFLADTFASKPTSGRYALDLVIALPEGWSDAVSAATKKALRRIAAR
jgi:hypothetical protein